MSDGGTYAKPGAGTPGFARSALSRLVALPLYRIGQAGANLCLPFLPVAVDRAGYGAALLWGELQ
jgi:hypothetical protein